jgi:hypothetical protein
VCAFHPADREVLVYYVSVWFLLAPAVDELFNGNERGVWCAYFSPKISKIEPEEFLQVVQKLTGRRSVSEETVTRFSFDTHESTSSSSDADQWPAPLDDIHPSRQHHPLRRSNDDYQRGYRYEDSKEFEDSEMSDAAPLSTRLTLAAARPTPRLVTINFMPLLASPRSLDTSRTGGRQLPLHSAA